MVKVIVRRASTGVAAASTLLMAAGTGALGCAAEGDEGDAEFLTESDLTLTAGAATLELLPGALGQFGLMMTQSTTDEFVRVGESLTLSLPAWLLWQEIYPNDPVPDVNRLKMLQATVAVHSYDKATKIGTRTVAIASFSGADPYDLHANVLAFVVASKTDKLLFDITIKDAMSPAASAQIPAGDIGSVAVFGGELPAKTVFFDTNGGQRQQRIIEGDSVVAGASMTFSYSDWRADMIADKSAINAQIGVAQTATRFGMADAPIYGKIVHEVSYGIYFNDATGWRPEASLTPTTSSRILSAGRIAFETTLTVPAKATKMSLYAHVKTYLVADYSPYANITQKWFADNEKVQKFDGYDNPFGSFTNYDYNLQN